jgi:hypothetical protein
VKVVDVHIKPLVEFVKILGLDEHDFFKTKTGSAAVLNNADISFDVAFRVAEKLIESV